MIEFIHWISFKKHDFKNSHVPTIVCKKGGEYKKAERAIFFLTDNEVFLSVLPKSNILNSFFSGIKKEDLLNHKSIKAYFANQGYVGLEAGKEFSLKDFWDIKKLPAVLASKLKSPEEFEKHWGKTFHSLFNFYDILYVLRYAPQKWKELAWQEVLKRKTSLSELNAIVDRVDSEYPQEALKKIFNCFFLTDNLFRERILFFMKQPGWNKFCSSYLKEPRTTKNLCLMVVIAGSEKLKYKAWNELIKFHLNFSDFAFMLNKLKELGEKGIGEKWQEWQKIIFEKFSKKRDLSDNEIIQLLDLVSSIDLLKKISNNWNFSQKVMLEAKRRLLLVKGLERGVFGFKKD